MEPPLAATAGKRVVGLRRLGKRIVIAFEDHAAAIAQKHYLPVTEQDFQLASRQGAAKALQKQTLPGHDSTGQELPNSEHIPQKLAGSVIQRPLLAMWEVPLIGLEPITR
jgi:hypothetical protein